MTKLSTKDQKIMDKLVKWEHKCEFALHLGTINPGFSPEQGSAELYKENKGMGRYFWKRYDGINQTITFEFLNDKVGSSLAEQLRRINGATN